MGTIHHIRPQKRPDNKWGHGFSLGFSVKSKNPGDVVTPEELLKGMEKRVEHLRANPCEIFEACGFSEELGE
ncbi:MAG: hypothetical protein ACD_74C00132G0001 [uncultured bacterium]|nr:MAG: hypothetical protein ACD_74C00132G0001 [uncultured bacterium]